MEFSAEDATRTDVAFLCQVIRAAVEAGATTINIPDTVGYTLPREFAALMETLFRDVEGLENTVVSVHCHDDLGLAVANSLGRHRGRCAAGRVYHQRHRGACRQRVSRGDRDGPQGKGDGPIAAAFSAIDELTDATVEIADFEIVAATPGRDAVGEVNLHARIDGQTFAGRGASTDVVDAAARAYIHALNKAEQAKTLEGMELEKESYVWGV